MNKAASPALRTALAYFSEGRVKVTYIIDTVMVTVLTEVMAFCPEDPCKHRVESTDI